MKTKEIAGQTSLMEILGDGLFGKTCQEPCPVTRGGTSDACCKPSATSAIKASPFLSLRKENGLTQEASWEMVSPWHGGSLIFNTSEHLRKPHLSAVDGYTLSAILEENVPEKYCLSAKACNGILRRARERGKTLPELLLNALKEVVGNGDGCES